MTPIQDQARRVLDAVEEGQVIMLINLLPIAYEDDVTAFGMKFMFEKILKQLKWDEEDISYWASYFNLTDDIEE